MSKPTLPEVLPLALAYKRSHPHGQVGGSLHVVLDDGNVGDRSVEFCVRWAEEQGDTLGAELARVLLRMSKTQRRKLGGMWSRL